MIRSAISVKSWLRQTPTVEQVRPSVCVGCGAAGRPAGAGLGLHGHGLRLRQFRGPPSVGAPPRITVLPVRRYQCQHCPAVLTVVPSETVPRRHYAATAIALALALFGLCGRSHSQVRAAVSSDATVGVSATRRWSTLSRWVDAVAARRLFPSMPAMPTEVDRCDIAARAAMAIGAHAPPSLDLGAPEARAFLGAAHLP